jgi:ornithine cyclodeaminase/alanine dehydrogenase-like protein (mu-crystallin family)
MVGGAMTSIDGVRRLLLISNSTLHIVFDSTGMALQDVVAAAILYEKAERQAAGVRLSFAA